MKQFFITDVFSEGPYSGNQLATLPDASGIDAQEMQKIAREFNFAETTFITGGSLDEGFDVRIFTPVSELPFAGHPTLGTSYILRNEILKTEVPEIRLNLAVGQIPVTFGDDGVLWMQQNSPIFGEQVTRDDIAKELALNVDDIDNKYPVQFVSTGLEFLMVPVLSYQALSSARVVGGELSQGYFVFCRGGYSADQGIQARMFATRLGVPEDPATGSANGCLAAYLAEYAYLGDTRVDVRVGQGYEINRPSQLYLRSDKSELGISVQVGGKVRVVAEGTWRV